MVIVAELNFRHCRNFFILLKNRVLRTFLHLNISLQVFIQWALQRSFHVKHWWEVGLSRKFKYVALQIICIGLDFSLLLSSFSCQLSGNYRWNSFVSIFNKIVKIIFRLRTLGTARILIEVSQKFFNLVFLLFFVIKLSDFEFSIGLEVIVCVRGNKLLYFIFLHLHFSLEVSQFIGIKGIKGDILEEVLSLEILIFMVLDGFKVFLDLLLLLLLIWRLDFWLVGLALLFLFEKLTHICVTLSFSNADLRLGWGDVLGLRLFGYFKVKL